LNKGKKMINGITVDWRLSFSATPFVHFIAPNQNFKNQFRDLPY